MTQRRRPVLVATVAAALAVDAASKLAAVAWLADGPVRVGPVLTLRLVHNEGIAFGIAASVSGPVVLVVTGAVATAVAVLAWRGALGAPVAAGLVVGGALANVADRATGGSVVDFLDIGRWPTFNLADVFLVTGIVLAAFAAKAPAPAA